MKWLLSATIFIVSCASLQAYTVPHSPTPRISNTFRETTTKPAVVHAKKQLNPEPWSAQQYRYWFYIPRDDHFYVNSILGSQNSLVAVKQNVINNMLSSARFDDVIFNNIWVVGLGSFLSNKCNENQSKFKYSARGYSLAVDAKPHPDFILGAAFSQVFGHAKSDRNVMNYKHNGSDHSFQATLYGGKSFIVDHPCLPQPYPILLQGVITYGHMKHDTTTEYPSIQSKNVGNWDDLGWLLNLRATLDIREPTLYSASRCSLFTELEYTGVRQPKIKELDYDPRIFSACAYRNLAIPIGVTFEGALLPQNILVYQTLSLAYAPVIYRNKPVCTYYIPSIGKTGEVAGNIPTRNAIRAEYSTQVYPHVCWTLYGSFTMEVGMSSLVQMASGGARMIF